MRNETQSRTGGGARLTPKIDSDLKSKARLEEAGPGVEEAIVEPKSRAGQDSQRNQLSFFIKKFILSTGMEPCINSNDERKKPATCICESN
ncbi:hypothetical protein EVAR_71319_1 [Eumeta japonica]|uniref:Uncharacterized protein n=1 Tax=Eumeta variegata TaxID=151549 RepID=A0A4C2AB80_EUMVA|nr:hypothetical protein EVAR_71319_1 [Eumeta japonica]